MNNDLSELNSKYRDYDSVKNQATHVETFKSELIRAREETNRVRTELENRINSINAETNGKINGINEENEKNKLRRENIKKIIANIPEDSNIRICSHCKKEKNT